MPSCGLVDAGQQPQQGGFAGTIGADDADDVAGGYGQGQLREECAVVVSTGKILGNKGCSHYFILSLRPKTGRPVWQKRAVLTGRNGPKTSRA